MRKVFLLLLLTAAPASAHDHKWFYDRSEWQADLCRGRELTRVSDCDAALAFELRRQFDQFDRQVLSVYIRDIRPSAPTQPAPTPPRP